MSAFDEIAREVAGRGPASNGYADTQRDQLDVITPIDWRAIANTPPAPRQFIVPDWLGIGHVTMLPADGGVGKTQLAVQLSMSTAIGRPWLGIETSQGAVMMLAAEDDDEELHRRVCRTAEFMAIGKADLAGKLFLQGRVGFNNELMLHPKGRRSEPLPLLAHIEEQARAVGARTIVLDNAAQFFSGEENARGEVTPFINGLNGMARRLSAAVLLLSHPPKSGADYSGSTAWHAAVRCLWTLKRTVAEDGDEPSDVMILTRVKANYAPPGAEIRLRWIDGVLRLADEPVVGIQASFQRHAAETTFLAALDDLTSQQRAASHSKRAANFAPKLIIEAGLANGITRRDLERAMNDLLRDGRIKADALLWRRGNRAWVTGLARQGHDMGGSDE